MATMIATVIRVSPRNLLVMDEENGEEVLVHFHNTSRFSFNDRILITYNGQKTFSIPPQITATSIQIIRPTFPSPQPTPSEFRAEVVQLGGDFLLVRNTQSRQMIRVEYPHSNHFCVRQQVTVRYDTISFSNPPTVTATDIVPIC